MNRTTRSLCLAVGALAFGAPRPSACVNVGVYQDKPAKTLPALQKAAGKNVKTVSTYVTVGHALDPKLVKLATQEAASRCSSAGCPTRAGQRQGARLPPQRHRRGQVRRRAEARSATQIKALQHGAIVRPMPDAEHALVRVVGHRQRQPPRRLRAAPGSTCARCCARPPARRSSCSGASYARSVPGHHEERASRCTSRAPSRSTSWAPTPTTSATPRASPGRRPADLFAPAYGDDPEARQEAVLDLRDRLHRPRRRRGRLDRRARAAGQDHAEARRGRLVRRQGQHRRLPRAAHGAAAVRVQGVRSRRVQVGIRSHESLVEGE